MIALQENLIWKRKTTLDGTGRCDEATAHPSEGEWISFCRFFQLPVLVVRAETPLPVVMTDTKILLVKMFK